MKKKLKNESITPIVVMSLIIIPPLYFYVIMPLFMTAYYLSPNKRAEYKQFVEDEDSYGPKDFRETIDSPSKSEAEELCIKRSKELIKTNTERYKEMNDTIFKDFNDGLGRRPVYSYVPVNLVRLKI